MTSNDTENLLREFWDVESVPERNQLPHQEKMCEQLFISTTKRNLQGRFKVKLPFEEGPNCLGQSKTNDMKKFMSFERTLHKNLKLFKKYSAFVQEFLSLGHMEKSPLSERHTYPHFNLPHHCLAKDDSTITKLRVVFDKCSKSQGLQMLQKCTQVALAKEQKNLHRILWRFKDTQPVNTYRMTRSTYNITSSSFHSIRSLLTVQTATTFRYRYKQIDAIFTSTTS